MKSLRLLGAGVEQVGGRHAQGFSSAPGSSPSSGAACFCPGWGALGYTVLNECPELPDFGEVTESTRALPVPGSGAGILWDAFSKE